VYKVLQNIFECILEGRAEQRGLDSRGNERSGPEWSGVVRRCGEEWRLCGASAVHVLLVRQQAGTVCHFGDKKGTRTSFCLCLVGDNNPISKVNLG